jgi:hypothetical protein
MHGAAQPTDKKTQQQQRQHHELAVAVRKGRPGGKGPGMARVAQPSVDLPCRCAGLPEQRLLSDAR